MSSPSKKMIDCPQCNKKIEYEKYFKYQIRLDKTFFRLLFRELFSPWEKGLESIRGANIVVCPNCEKEFKVNNYKLFGIFRWNPSFKNIILLFIYFIIIFIALPVLLLILLR